MHDDQSRINFWNTKMFQNMKIINVLHPNNQMKQKNPHIMISIDVENAFDTIQHSYDKKLSTKSNRRKPPQYSKSHK